MVARKLRRTWYRRLIADKHLRSIKRGTRDRCWCGGELLPFQWHSSYGICKLCGTYVNRRPPLREDLQRLYSLDLYWHLKQKVDGLPVIERRTAHDLADGRVDFWLTLIDRYAPPKGRIIEIGCAHGVLLQRLQQRGYDCIGVEIDPRLADWTREQTGLDVRAGVFPGIDLPSCNLFLAMDVLEHSHDPQAFLRGASSLLNSGGIAILQTTVDRYGEQPPFGIKFDYAFDDLEHLFIFTDQALLELGRRCGFAVINSSERLWTMGEICVYRKD